MGRLQNILRRRHIWLLKTAFHGIAAGLLGYTYFLAFSDQLGGDPVKAILHFTGMGALNCLLLCLLVHPLSKWPQQAALMHMRRMIGLWSFAYALFHFVSYIVFELQLEWRMLIAEVIERPYITVGFAALLILLALAATSMRNIQRLLGRRWQVLHHSIYIAGLLTVLHFIWSVKSGITEPLIYIAVLLFLLALRFKRVLRFYRNQASHHPT